MPYGTIDGQINLQSTSAGGGNATASAGNVSSGVGVTIGSSYTGRYLIIVSGVGSNGTAGSGGLLTLYRTTSGIPTVGSAVTGTQITTGATGQGTSTATGNPFTASFVVVDPPGIGTFSYYVAFAAVTSGTFTIATTGLTITAVEL
jgi:hypothetical protein